MDPTLFLGLGQTILNMGAEKKKQALAQASLNETRRSNMESEKLAKASQTDAMGNKVRYIDGIGWVSEASPIVKAILDAGAREQLTNLREDQPRERAAAIRQDNRSQTAGSAYSKAFDKYRYGKQPNEAEAQADEVLATVADREYNPASAGAFNQAIRTDNPQLLRALYGSEQGNKGSLTAALIRAKRAGTGQYLAEKGARDQAAFGEMGQLRSVADGTPDSAPQYSNANDELAGRQSNAMSQLISVISNNGSKMASAYGNAANSVSPIDITGIGKLIIDKYGKTAEQKALEEAMYNSDLSGAQLKYQTNLSALNKLKANQGSF